MMPERNETSWNSEPNKFDFRDGTKPPNPTLTKTLMTERLTVKVNRPNREPDDEWRRDSRMHEETSSNPRLGPS